MDDERRGSCSSEGSDLGSSRDQSSSFPMQFQYFFKGDSTPQEEMGENIFAPTADPASTQFDSPSAKMTQALGKRKTELDQLGAISGKKFALDKTLSFGDDAPENLSSMSLDQDSLSSPVSQWLDAFHSLETCDKIQALTFLVDQCSISEVRHLRKTIEPYFQKDFIRCLPKELALHILSLLDSEDLSRVAQINNNWRRSKSPLGNPRNLRGHDEHVITCLQICGDKVYSGSDDNTLRVWSVSRGECLHVLNGHTGGVWSSHVTSDGRYLASGSTDRTVKIWDTDTGECLFTLQGHTSTVRCMSLQGTTLVTGSRDTTLRVWNMITGELLHVLAGHVAAVRCVQFDGVRAVSGAYDYTIKARYDAQKGNVFVWDVATEECTATLAGHTNRIYSLQMESERNLVISGSLDTTIRVWDILSGHCLQTLMGHQSLTSGMELRGKILVSGNADSTLKVWDITDGTCLYTLSGQHRHKSAVTSLQFLENGLVVTSSDDGTVKLWDSEQGTFVRDLVRLDSGGSGGCIWRLKATPTTLVCAVGSRHGTEDTKLIILDFNADFP